MKKNNHLLAYMGLLGITTLIAILWAIRDKLVAVGPWVLGVLLTVSGLVIVYLLYKLYTSFKREHLALQERVYEVENRKQALRIENERWEVERASLLLDQHLQKPVAFIRTARAICPPWSTSCQRGHMNTSILLIRHIKPE